MQAEDSTILWSLVCIHTRIQPPHLPNPPEEYDKNLVNIFINCNRTLPAGYMEIGESAAEGAMRETWEEAGAEVQILSPFAQLDIPRIGQVRKIMELI